MDFMWNNHLWTLMILIWHRFLFDKFYNSDAMDLKWQIMVSCFYSTVINIMRV